MARWPHFRVAVFARSLLALVALALGVGVAVGVAGAARSEPFASASHFPLALTNASVSLHGKRLTGSAVVENTSATRVPATEGALAWHPAPAGALAGLATVSLPSLAPHASVKLKLHARVSSHASAGKYAVLMCLDVTSQVQRFDPRANCTKVSNVKLKASAAHKAHGPAPNTKIESGESGTVDSAAATFTFSSPERGVSFQCSLDGGPRLPCTSPARYQGLASGPHTFEVRATSANGVTDSTPAKTSWTVTASGTATATTTTKPTTTTTTTPTTTTTTGPAPSPAVTLTLPANGATVNQAKPMFSGAAGTASGNLATIAVKVYSGSSVSGTAVQTLTATASGGSWSVAASTALADGTYAAQAQQSDSAGNVGKSSANTFTVTTTPPKTTITSAPSGRVPTGPVSISFTSNEAGSTFQCSRDNAAFASCTSPYNISNPAPGPHTFSVEATNQAGVTETTPAMASWSSVQPEQGLCGSLMGSTTIGPDYAARYVLTCNFDVPALTTLTAQPGTIIKADARVQLSVEGSLVARGTSGSPITFTSINDNSVGGSTGSGSPAAGDWAGIQASGSGSLDVEHALVEYGSSVGGPGFGSLVALNDTFSLDGGYAAVFGTGASVTVKDNSFVSPSGSAVVVSSPQLQLSGNTASGISSATVGGQAYWADSSALDFAALSSNTSDAGALVVSGAAVTSTWSGSIPLLLETGGEAISGGYFSASAVLDVPSGATLTLAPGTIVKGQGPGARGGSISVEGSLVARGTSGSPITFTSINDNSVGGSTGSGSPAAGDWAGIQASGSGSLDVEHALVEYGSSVGEPGFGSLVALNDTFSLDGGLRRSVWDGRECDGQGQLVCVAEWVGGGRQLAAAAVEREHGERDFERDRGRAGVLGRLLGVGLRCAELEHVRRRRAGGVRGGGDVDLVGVDSAAVGDRR